MLSPYGLDFLATRRGIAAPPNTGTPLLVEFDPLCQPESPGFETVPLGNSDTIQPRGLIKSEHIKQEVPRQEDTRGNDVTVPKREPASPGFETVPLRNSEAGQPRGFIKSEHMKQEVP